MPRKAKILLIEDEKAIADMYEMKLKDRFEVETAPDAKTGLEAIKKEKPVLILLDILLPDFRGTRILEILKESPRFKDIPIIILSNYDTPEVRDLAKKHGVKYFLKTNVINKDLIKLVEEELRDAPFARK